jgi:hypothetical protein
VGPKPAGDDLKVDFSADQPVMLWQRHKQAEGCRRGAVQQFGSHRTRQCPMSFHRNGMLLYRAPRSCVHMMHMLCGSRR